MGTPVKPWLAAGIQRFISMGGLGLNAMSQAGGKTLQNCHPVRGTAR